MLRAQLRPGLLLLAIALWPGAGYAAETEATPLPEAEALYARLRARHAPMFEKYAGTETRTVQQVVRYDARSGEVRERSKLVAKIRDYFFAPREVEALQYWRDGEAVDPEDYKDRGSKEPRHPLLHESGPEHYRLEVLGREKKHGHDCLRVRFLPREKTPRHLEGEAWFDEASLELVAVDMHPAKLPFGVQQLSTRMRFRQEGDVMLSAGGVTRVMIHVPLVFPHNLMVIRDEPLEARGIPR